MRVVKTPQQRPRVVGSVPVIERQIHQQKCDYALHDKVRRNDRRQAPMVLRNALQYAGGDRLHNDESNGKREPEMTALMTSLAANRLFGLRNGKSLSSASSARNASGTM